MITWAVLRVVASVVVVTAVYYLLPFDRSATGVAVTLLVAGLVVFVGLVAFQVRASRPRRAPSLSATGPSLRQPAHGTARTGFPARVRDWPAAFYPSLGDAASGGRMVGS
jgi:ABC-type uncharacterized transport system permease subunit